MKTGISSGLKVRYFLNQNQALSFGLNYQRKSYEFNNELIFCNNIKNGLGPTIINDKLVLNLITVPLNFEFWFPKSWIIGIGVSYRKVVKKTKNREIINLTDPSLLTAQTLAFNEFPFGFSFMVGKMLDWGKTALQISPIFQFSFDEIQDFLFHETNTQFSTGLDLTFWFK